MNAAGSWADQIAELAGIKKIGLQPMRRSAALIPAPDGHGASRWPLFYSEGFENYYAKPDAGRLMVSPAEEQPMDPHDAWPDNMTLAEGIAAMNRRLQRQVTRIEHSWAGLRTFAPDRYPVLGFDPQAEGFFWLAGQGATACTSPPRCLGLPLI